MEGRKGGADQGRHGGDADRRGHQVGCHEEDGEGAGDRGGTPIEENLAGVAQHVGDEEDVEGGAGSCGPGEEVLQAPGCDGG
eukprot:1244680-Amphidinium_carterae.1